MRSVLRAWNIRLLMVAALVLSAVAPWAGASEVSDGLASLDAIVQEAGSAGAFLEDTSQARGLRDRYYQQWVSMYPQGESQFPRANFDAVIAQVRKAVREHPELGTRLFETTGLGKSFSVMLDAESSGLELKQDEWRKFYTGWKRNLESGSKRFRALDEKTRESAVQRLSAELESEVQAERARIGALPKFAKLERGQAEAELQKRLLNDPRTQELASFVVHEKVFGKDGEALRDILNSGDADQVLIGMKQVQQKGGLGVPESLQSYVIKSAVPELEQPKLEVSASGKAAESELFKVKLRKTNRGKFIPEGRVAKTTLEFQTIPRRIHGLFKGIAIQECVGGGECESLSPERWGTIALQDSQLHLVVENGSLTPGFTHGVPVKLGKETFLSMDIQAPALNKAGVKNEGGSITKLSAYSLWIQEQQKLLPTEYRKILVGSSDAMSNGGNRPTVTTSPSYLFGRSKESTTPATAADASMRQVLLGQSGEKSMYGYGGNLITETTVQKAGALTRLEPSLENLSQKQILAILERGRPELRARILSQGVLALLTKKNPAVESSSPFRTLVRWGLGHENPEVRAGAARALKSQSGPEALKLKALALQDKHFGVRHPAAEALRSESGPEALELKGKALEHSDSAVRLAAAASLSNESGPDALQFKARALQHPDWDVRLTVVESLSKSSGPDSLALRAQASEVISEALEQDLQLRWRAAQALSNLSGPDALKLKAVALKNSNPWVRYYATASLSTESGPEAERLRQIALKDQAPEVRTAASELRLALVVESIRQISDSLAPPSDPLCQGCLPASGSASVEGASLEELARKMAGKAPEQMRRTPGFQSACQEYFGAFLQ